MTFTIFESKGCRALILTALLILWTFLPIVGLDYTLPILKKAEAQSVSPTEWDGEYQSTTTVTTYGSLALPEYLEKWTDSGRFNFFVCDSIPTCGTGSGKGTVQFLTHQADPGVPNDLLANGDSPYKFGGIKAQTFQDENGVKKVSLLLSASDLYTALEGLIVPWHFTVQGTFTGGQPYGGYPVTTRSIFWEALPSQCTTNNLQGYARNYPLLDYSNNLAAITNYDRIKASIPINMTLNDGAIWNFNGVLSNASASGTNSDGTHYTYGIICNLNASITIHKHKTPVIFIPGIAGTRLDANGLQVWPIPFVNPSALILPTRPDVTITTHGILDGTNEISLPIPHGDYLASKTNFYGDFINSLTNSGYTQSTCSDGFTEKNCTDGNLYTFPYDYRMDLSTQLDSLDKLVHTAMSNNLDDHVILIGHSMGGLVAEGYVMSNSDRASNVQSVITMGTPYLGAPKAYYALLEGYNFDDPLFSSLPMKLMSQNMPGAYELLPQRPFVSVSPGNLLSLSDTYNVRYTTVNCLPIAQYLPIIGAKLQNSQCYSTSIYSTSWTIDQNTLATAQKYWTVANSEQPYPVPLYTIIGYGYSTLDGFSLRPPTEEEKGFGMFFDLPNGESVVGVPHFGEGDGTVPDWSSNPGARSADKTYYVSQATTGASASHGDLPKNPTVQAIVKQIIAGNPPDPIQWYPKNPNCETGTCSQTDFTLHSNAVLSISNKTNGTLGYNSFGGISEDLGSFLDMDGIQYASIQGSNLTDSLVATINGTGDGQFSLSVNVINGSTPIHSFVYPSVPVKNSTNTVVKLIPAHLVDTNLPKLNVTNNGVTTQVAAVNTLNVEASETVVNCNPASISLYNSTTCTAIVSGSSPTGTISFSTSSVNGGSVTPSSTSCTLNSGSCSIFFSGSSSGSVTVTAHYFGDMNNAPSSSATNTIVSNFFGCTPATVDVNVPTLCKSPKPQSDVYFSQTLAASDGLVFVYNDQNSVYVYNDTTGVLVRTFTSPNSQQGGFGSGLAAQDGLVVIGAPFEPSLVAGNSCVGNVYIFNATTGSLVRSLSSPIQICGGRSLGSTGGNFGLSASLGSGVILVGDRGQIYGFNATNGLLMYTLNTKVAPFSIDVNNGLGIAGIPMPNSDGNAYLFNVTTGSLIHNFVSSNSQPAGSFGQSVSIAGGVVMIGAPGENNVQGKFGNVYLFNDTNGSLIRMLNPGTSGNFGQTIASNGSTVFVGAAGVAYKFDLKTGALINTLSINTSTEPNFGFPIILGNGFVVVGAGPSHAYVFYNAFLAAAYHLGLTQNGVDVPNAGNVNQNQQVTVMASSNNTQVAQVEFKWANPDGVIVQVSNTTSTFQDSYTPTTPGRWHVLAIFSDISGTILNQTRIEFDIPLHNPIITTTLSNQTISIGDSVSDTAYMTNATLTANGTVLYEFYSGISCSGTPSVVSNVPVTDGIIPNSGSHTFNVAGAYSWNAVYSGDSANSKATGQCESLIVRNMPLITTSLSSSTIVAGNSINDSTVLTGASSYSNGTIQSFWYEGSSCQGKAHTLSSVSVPIGSPITSKSKTLSFVTWGNFSFNAMFINQDPFDTTSTSTCEPLSVTVNIPQAHVANITATPSLINPGQPSNVTVSWSNQFLRTVAITPHFVTLYTSTSPTFCTGLVPVAQNFALLNSTTFVQSPNTMTSYCASVIGGNNSTLDQPLLTSNPSTISVGGSSDLVPPIVNGTPARPTDSNGWYNHTISIIWNGTDNEVGGTGITSCDPPTVYSGPDGKAITIQGHCTDNAGNIGADNFTLNYDSTPPIIEPTRNPLANANGWNNSTVTVSFSCNDATSGVAQCPLSANLTKEGFNQTVHGTVVDKADNSASITVRNINIDLTPPIAYSQSITVNENSSKTIVLAGKDVGGDSITFLILANANHGKLGQITKINSTSSMVTYSPNPNYNGPDIFTFKTYDGHVDDGKPATISIRVNGLPDITKAVSSQTTLWPPDHKMATISILGVKDPDGEPVTINITGIKQDEPTTGLGSGDQSPDASGIGTTTAHLRAERDGTGDGRVYHIYFSADDGKGGIVNGVILVSVPHDLSGKPAVDEGPIYDSTKP